MYNRPQSKDKLSLMRQSFLDKMFDTKRVKTKEELDLYKKFLQRQMQQKEQRLTQSKLQEKKYDEYLEQKISLYNETIDKRKQILKEEELPLTPMKDSENFEDFVNTSVQKHLNSQDKSLNGLKMNPLNKSQFEDHDKSSKSIDRFKIIQQNINPINYSNINKKISKFSIFENKSSFKPLLNKTPQRKKIKNDDILDELSKFDVSKTFFAEKNSKQKIDQPQEFNEIRSFTLEDRSIDHSVEFQCQDLINNIRCTLKKNEYKILSIYQLMLCDIFKKMTSFF